jgi:hypothetical protein
MNSTIRIRLQLMGMRRACHVACVALATTLGLGAPSSSTAQSTAWTQTQHGIYRATAYPSCHAINASASRALAVFPNGDIVVTGCSENGNDEDWLTVKYRGTDGAILWSATYTGSYGDDEGAAAVAIDGAGNVVVTGFTRSLTTGKEIRTIKYNGTTGAEMWNVVRNGTAGFDDRALDIAIGPGDNVFVTGQIYESPSALNIATVKYNGADGQQLWAASLNGTAAASVDTGHAIVIDASGDAYVVGVAGEAAASEFRIVKYNGTTGAQSWSVTSGLAGDAGRSIAIDPSGNVVAAGYAIGGDSVGDFRVVKLNPATGAEIWSVPVVVPGHDFVNSLAIDAAGDIVVTGTASNVIRTVKLAGADGAIVWNVTHVGASGNLNAGLGLALDSAGNALITGYSTESGTLYAMRTIKYQAADGAVLWSKDYPNSPTEVSFGYAIGVDASGNALVAGGAPDGVVNGWRVIKYAAADGTQLWTGVDPPVPGTNTLSAKSLTVSADNSRVAIAGRALDGIEDETVQVAQYDTSNGNRIWLQALPGYCLENGLKCAMKFDASGDLVIASAVYTAGSVPHIRLTKLAGATGAPIWGVTYNVTAKSWPSDLHIDASGDIVVTGMGDDGTDQWDIRTIKFNGSNGAEMWSAVFTESGTSTEEGRHVRFDAAGNVVVVGINTNPSGTIHVLKYNGATGAQMWNANAVGVPTSLAIDAAGDVVVAGTSTEGGSGSNLKTLKYNGATGAHIWSALTYGPGRTQAFSHGIAVNPAGDVFITGLTNVTNGTRWFVIKYSASVGAYVWSNTYNPNNGGGFTSSLAIVMDGNNPVLTGDFAAPGEAHGIWTAKFDGAAGTPIWTHAYGGSEATGLGIGTAIALGAPGSVFVAGNLRPLGKPQGFFLEKIFEPSAAFALTVARNGTGTGTVASTTPGINCGSDCTETYVTGAVITVIATPDAGSTFGSWAGCDSVTANQCTVTMNSARTVTATFTRNVIASDFNGDGRSDILWYHVTLGALYELQMNGFATGAAAVIDQQVDLNWKVVAVADINGDGKADVVWQNNATGEIYGLLMDGVTVAGEGLIYVEPNTNWKVVGAGDFDADGKADLLWKNDTTGDVFLLLLNGLAPAGGGVIYSEPNADWVIQKVADFNGDKRADVLWRNTATGDVFVLLMNGGTVIGGGVIYSEPNVAWQIQAAADFNGDGKADVLWRNTATGDLFMMLMDGTTITGGSVIYGEPNADWKIVAAGDYNGDTRADILWRNTATGQVFMMLMNGFTITAGDFVYTEPDQDWTILGP